MPEAGSPVPVAGEGDLPHPGAPKPCAADPAVEALCLFATLVSAGEPKALWRTLAGEAGRLFQAQRTGLYLVADGGLRGVWPTGGEGDETVRQALSAQRLIRGRGAMAAPIMADGSPVGVLEVAAKAGGGSFTGADAQRLAALGIAAGIAFAAVEQAADLLTLKSYCDVLLQATSNCVISFEGDGRIVGCNPIALRMLRRRAVDVLGKQGRRIFRGDNAWVVGKVRHVALTGVAEVAPDAKLWLDRRCFDVNAAILPFVDRARGKTMVVVVLDDVSGREQAREVLSRYLDPRLAGRMLVCDERRASARPVRATLLFCDLRDSTSMAETLGAQRMMALLNEHFAFMEGCLRAEGGMIDKFIGDALLATFGVPQSCGDDEDRAVRAALAMTAALRRWNETRAAGGLLQVEMGIGINTDIVVAGDVGSPRRMDFTVVGAGVNAAARLEKACKRSGAAILATVNTIRRLKGRYAIRPADPLPLPGRAEPLEVFEILGDVDTPFTAALQRALLIYRRAFSSKRNGRFAEAVAGFSECLSLNPTDRAAARQLAACRAAGSAPQR